MAIPSRPRRFNSKRVAGVVVLAFGAAFLVSGLAFVYMNATMLDAEGFSLSSPHAINTQTCGFFMAIHSENSSSGDTHTKFVITNREAGKELFFGWAWFDDFKNYTSGWMFEVPTHWTWDWGAYWSTLSFGPTVVYNANMTPGPKPENATIWLAHKIIKSGESAFHYDPVWEPKNAMKGMIFMNTDGSPGINAELRFGSNIAIFGWLPYPLIIIGIVLVAGGWALARRKGRA